MGWIVQILVERKVKQLIQIRLSGIMVQQLGMLDNLILQISIGSEDLSLGAFLVLTNSVITIPLLHIGIIALLVLLILRVIQKLIEGEGVSILYLMDRMIFIFNEVCKCFWMVTEFLVNRFLVLNITECSKLRGPIIT